ncbi:AtzE family amidohydrolase [Henriciella sp. AS95]|uniref:AtzE family amidohydrolase n=1 Tax=Henriciella sp. AS95 TaxID=3135782 RepID=UPI00317D82BC
MSVNGVVSGGAVEAVSAALGAVERFDDELNCFTRICRSEALSAAADLDERLKQGEAPGPLSGVPFAVKDLFDVKGLPTTAGSAILQHAPAAKQEAPVVERLKQAGAILTGTLNMDEFAYGFATVNSHFGVTHNPHDPTRLAGGSSGGSAAAVAAGLVPLSLGSDTNGSVRVPASLCGIFGLRPTHGAFPMEGVYPFVDRLDTAGIFTRSMDLMRAAFRVLGQTEATNPAPDTLKVGLLGGWFKKGGQQVAFDAAQTVFEALGGEDEVVLDLAEAGRSASFLITAYEGGCLHLPYLRTQPMDYDPAVRDRLIAGAMLPDKMMADAREMADRSIQEVWYRLDEYDVLIAPATPCTAPDIEAGTIEIDGEMVSARANLGLYTQPLSLPGVPILSVPVRQNKGLPMGVQLIAARGREEVLFDVAERLLAEGVVAIETPRIFAGAT